MAAKRLAVPLSLAILLGLTAFTRGDDWPQWLGPKRNNISGEKGLLKTWRKEGPPLLWTATDAGSGYSGPAIVGDRLFIMGARDKKEFIQCLDANTGKQVWRTDFGTLFTHSWGDGPRGTPTVDGELIYAIGGEGDLVCV